MAPTHDNANDATATLVEEETKTDGDAAPAPAPTLVLRQGFAAIMGYLQRMFDVTATGHVDLRDLELQDMPADLLGVVGVGDGEKVAKTPARKGKRKQSGAAPITKLLLTGNKLQYLPAFVGELSALRYCQHAFLELVRDESETQNLHVLRACPRGLGA